MSVSSINRLRQMAVFSHVIECGSMRAAAAKLGLTPSAVSQHLTQLEAELDIVLIYRSTRTLKLSEAGERYYRHVKQMLLSADDADDAIHEIKHSLGGELRISAPVGLAARPLGQAIKPVLDKNKGLMLTVLADDNCVDLVAQQIDIAIRVGNTKESSYCYHELGRITKSIYASPEYLSQYKHPLSPSDLQEHFWLGTVSSGCFGNEIELQHLNQDKFTVSPHYRMKFNDINVLSQHIEQGFGLALLPDLEVAHLVDSGRLVKLLPEWGMESHPLYALTVDRAQSFKVTTVLKELKNYFSAY